ncbi:branched-chain amino acid transport [Arcobacter nitrofigilis DSM 7299]|uniref:Branched-chain amino acid transport n=1 Tax=Arcobacter nitrofigilis (strain ATCC 33309 / DSM 7299 / CCUG 15893 / LMG 7604 / NCTC 12251 / CI) TaxID=572480 RepID=D5V523_ARCNC|nr:AzlD domain-containing protein [Arcobacter nitrofigilis]ADG91985.1 branched-chain amino acid transport [Arcobacter nitrofigilis DSM 7299]
MSDSNMLLIIFAVAIGTYFLRVSGLLLSTKLKKLKYVNSLLESIPATLLIALIIPPIIKEGMIGIIASLFVIIVMIKSKNIFLSMSIGVFIIYLSRSNLLF